MAKTQTPAIDGWFDEAGLKGLRCDTCATVVFPPRALVCPNPNCAGREFSTVTLSRTGTVWSYATNHYAPPAPYVAADPFVPFTVAAVELDDERIVVLGEATGEVAIGDRVELTIGTLFEDDEHAYTVWKWRPVA